MYLKNGQNKLLSVTKIMNSGLKLQGDENSISLRKHSKQLTFNIKIQTMRGVLFAVKINKRVEVNAIVDKMLKKVKKMTLMKAHHQLEHLAIQATKDAAVHLGWHLKGNFERCEDRAIGKGRQKKVNKTTDHKVADNVGERISCCCLGARTTGF
jgi:hypothetical protein